MAKAQKRKAPAEPGRRPARAAAAPRKKRKPSFDPPSIPAQTGTASSKVAETAWVYRSDAESKKTTPMRRKTILDRNDKRSSETAAPAPAASALESPMTQGPPRNDQAAPIARRMMAWMAVPFEMAILMALVPLRSRQPETTAVRKGADG